MAQFMLGAGDAAHQNWYKLSAETYHDAYNWLNSLLKSMEGRQHDDLSMYVKESVNLKNVTLYTWRESETIIQLLEVR